MKIELGDFENSQKIIQKLNDIGHEFGDEHAKIDSYYLNSRLLIKKREPYNAIEYANDGIILLKEMDWEPRNILLFAMKLRIKIMQDDLEAAKKTINEVENLISKRGKYSILSFHYSDYLMGIFLYNLARLESSIYANDKENILKYKKATSKNGEIAAKHSRKKVASDRTEAYKLMGVYYWLIDKQKKAIKWWKKSIEEGEHIGANLELSRTYFEVGKRLLEKKSKYKELNGINAKEYLEKARIMFEEMDLQWDLDELDRIASDS